ncbi:unnamed protein product [Microthlaspi erraticum]|uniref:Autophagy-related protein 13 N-terminal domain-containing protein n=1 Tax=Microthlaspi erraticum TaxID=1685480 RepID=A0A6D2KMB9_9BRAS|nr:unnamed protein product [Microthlaspi erraticum]
MSSSQNRSGSNSESAKAEQIIFEFFAKSLHIILESRTPFMSSRNFSGDQMVCSSSSSSSSSSSVRPRDKWFNLALRECPAALESFDIGRRSSLEPLVVNVVLVASPFATDQIGKRELIRNFSGGWSSDQDEMGCESKNEQIIERWIVQYDNRKVRESATTTSSRRSSSSNSKLQVMYKKATLLLRSLFVMVRLLPAYKIFRELNSSGQIFKFKLVPRVPSIVEPFTRREEAEMQRFAFTPVETLCGRLCLSVLYRSLSDVSCEHSTPMSPTFITDYVGSPLADPLKRFPSLPLSYGSPPLLPFQRRHSWSFDRYKASPPPSVSCSPSPTHSDLHGALVSNPCSRRLPPHPCDIPTGRRKECYVEECQDFSPPCSPSGAIHAVTRGITRTESAPVRIPAPSFQSKQNNVVAPSPNLKLSRHASLKPVRSSGVVESGGALEKFLYGREDFRRNSGVRLSSNSSPRISFSRSSSRSFQDDFDDNDFPCPFDVEDDDITDRSSRPGSYDQRGDIPEPTHEPSGSYPKKSQDAAVGALVSMLKKAPPLRQDVSITEVSWNNNNSNNNKPARGQEAAAASITASGLALASKTTADALEELRSYKEMKNVLLSQSAMDTSSVNTTTT